MSKKLIAALSLSLVLAACNTTADVTVDDEAMDSSASSVDAMMESSSSDESASSDASDSSDSSDSSASSVEGAAASVEADTSVETGY